MKKALHFQFILLLASLFIALGAQAQKKQEASTTHQPVMKTFLIERDIPGASALKAEDLKGISQKSCGVLKSMGPGIEWVHSYVAGDKIFCVYRAENEEKIREHGKKGGFPITSIREIENTISPATAQ
jgi:hypothetical protein